MSEPIQRYELETEYGGVMVPDDSDGQYVLYSDVIAMQERIAALEAVAEAAHNFISPINNRHSFTEFHDLEQALQAAGYGEGGQ